jgi:hypothetical protein
LLAIHQRTDNQNIQGTQKSKLPKTNEPIKKWATEINRNFSKEVQMANKHMKKMLTIPGHKGYANQTTLRFHLTPVTMAFIKNTINNKCWQRWGKKLPSHSAGGNVN